MFLIFLIVFLTSISFSQEPPNVVVLFSDDAGYGDFGFTGTTEFLTPNLDKMARDGIKINQGYVASTVCHPSRVGIMTGRNPVRIGHHFNGQRGLPDTVITIADQMKKAGYKTKLIGKWHLGGGTDDHPLNEGWDEFYGHIGGSHDYYNGNMSDGWNLVPFQGYLTDVFADKGVEFIEQNKDTTFFLFMSFNSPHSPYQSKPEHKDMFNGTYWSTVGGMHYSLDSACGLILNKLDEINLSEQTLVIYLNDNGGATNHNNAPFSGLKGDVMEGGVRVPFLVKWKGRLSPNTIYDQPISSMDIFPTISAIAGLDMPSDRTYDGINMLPFLEGRLTERPHKYLYWSKWHHAIRYKDYKLIDVPGTQPLLYDIPNDIKEENNLAFQKPGLTKALYDELHRFLDNDGITPLFYEGAIWDTISRRDYGNRLVYEPFPFVDSGIVLEPETDPDITLPIIKSKRISHFNIISYHDGFQINFLESESDKLLGIDIYNLRGNKISSFNPNKTPFRWNGILNTGQKISSGNYFIRLIFEKEASINKIIHISG